MVIVGRSSRGRHINTAALIAGVAFGAGAACDCGVVPVVLPPPDQIDVFEQRASARADVLFVVDNSSSMARKQAKVRARIGAFLDVVFGAGVDAHVGVVTTDPAEDGALRRFGGSVSGCEGCAFVDVDVADPVAVVDDLLDVGTAGSSFEEGFAQAVAAVDGRNVGFVRDDADLVVIFVSDEDEGPLQGGTDPRFVERSLRAQKPAGDEARVKVGALVGFPADGVEGVDVDGVCGALAPALDPAVDDVDGADGDNAVAVAAALADERNGCVDADVNVEDAFAELGGRYIELACRTGGVVGSICDDDYTKALTELALSTAGLRTRFALTRTDVAGGDDCAFFTGDDLVVDCNDDGDVDDDVDGALCVRARCDGADVDVDLPLGVWTWDPIGRAVVFGGGCVPAAGSDVVVRYGVASAPCR